MQARIYAWAWPLFLLAIAQPARAEHTVHARVDRDVASYVVHHDLTWEMVDEVDVTVFTRRGIHGNDRSAWTFYPDKQTLELVEAWVDQPDGTRITVPPSGIFTRPSAATEVAPGFVDSLTTTVLFPQLREGSRTHIVWRRTQKTPGLFGFNARNEVDPDWDIGVDQTSIEIPADIDLHWRARGFETTDQTENGIRHIVTRVRDRPGEDAESMTVSLDDFQPTFEATTLPDMAAMGAIVYRESKGRAAVTPEISTLAESIVGTRTGLDAARAIYDWVAGNIRYIAVYLSLDDGMVSHSATEVLHNGYGDCKDYVVLMQALLAARGIEGIPASIDWGSRYADPVSWGPYFTNHRIIYLPEFNRFANPTDRYAGFDALDHRLSGKLAVLATPDGAVLRTPESTPQQNRYRMQSHLTLTADGAIDGTASFDMSPNTEEYARALVSGASSMTDLADRLLQRTLEGGFGTMTAGDPRDLSRPFTLSASWHSERAANVQGDSIFLRVPPGPDLLPPGLERGRISPTGKRQHAELADARDQEWEMVISLPPGLRAEHLPDNIVLETDVGRYTAHYQQIGNDIDVSRSLVINHDVVEATDYPKLERLLYAAVVDARSVMVLVRGE